MRFIRLHGKDLGGGCGCPKGWQDADLEAAAAVRAQAYLCGKQCDQQVMGMRCDSEEDQYASGMRTGMDGLVGNADACEWQVILNNAKKEESREKGRRQKVRSEGMPEKRTRSRGHDRRAAGRGAKGSRGEKFQEKGITAERSANNEGLTGGKECQWGEGRSASGEREGVPQKKRIRGKASLEANGWEG